MKFVVLLLVVLVLVAVIWFTTRWVLDQGRRRAHRTGRWELDETSDGELLLVHAVHPTEQPLLVGSVPFASPDFEMRLEEVRAEGRYKLAALNSRSLRA